MPKALIEIWPAETWEILDPNTAQLVAVFYDEAKALAYQEQLNEAIRADNEGQAHDR